MNLSDLVISIEDLRRSFDPSVSFPVIPTARQEACLLLHLSGWHPEPALDTAAKHLIDMAHHDRRRKHWRDVALILLELAEEPTTLRERKT